MIVSDDPQESEIAMAKLPYANGAAGFDVVFCADERSKPVVAEIDAHVPAYRPSGTRTVLRLLRADRSIPS